jgi:phospholipase C
MGGITRRTFLRAAGAAGIVAATGGIEALTNAKGVRAGGPLPPPDQSGIEHIVVVCMENRSFDHYLGWVPGATGAQSGLSYLDNGGVAHSTHRLTDTWTGCGFNDPDHSYDGGRIQYNNGALDGFRKGSNDDYALGYYTAADIPFHAALVNRFAICDHWFCSFLGPTFPNRVYTHAAATDRIDNNLPPVQTSVSTIPTIWDNLQAANVSANYFFSDEPFLALWGTKYLPICRQTSLFFELAALGQLPQYSYIDPGFLDEETGSSFDDHPHADIRRGEYFLARVVNALISSPQWSSTVLVITYDEWGGFFDTVAPPQLPADSTTSLTGEPATFDHGQAGFRVPTYVISPFSPVGGIATGVYDHTSILKMAEWRWGLPSLTPRDAAANNVAEVLDFTNKPNLNAPLMPVIPDPGPHLCGGGMDFSSPVWPDFSQLPATVAIKAHAAALGSAPPVRAGL